MGFGGLVRKGQKGNGQKLMLPKTLAPETRCVRTKPSPDPTLISSPQMHLRQFFPPPESGGQASALFPFSPEPQSGAPVRAVSCTCPQKGSLKSPASTLSSSPTILTALHLQNKSHSESVSVL